VSDKNSVAKYEYSLVCTAAGVWIHREGLNSKWSNSCFRSKSVLFEGQVTRNLVSLRNVFSSSRVKCSLEERLRRWDMTKNPLPDITCCWMLVDDSTNSQMKLINFELQEFDMCI
jgi:hypothetical protein